MISAMKSPEVEFAHPLSFKADVNRPYKLLWVAAAAAAIPDTPAVTSLPEG